MTFKKKASFVAAVAVVLLLAGVAYSVWNTGGLGHGSAKASSSIALTTVAVPAGSTGLYPGADAKMTMRVVNDNEFPVRISDVSYGPPTDTTVSGALGTCTNGEDAALTFTNQHGLALDVAAHGSATFDVDGVHMGAASANGCQGATFTIPVALTGASNVAP